MYIHLGQNAVIKKSEIIGIFDMENTTSSRHTRAFLSRCEDEGEVVDISTDLPRVFVLCEGEDGERVYLSQLSSQTLEKRWDEGELGLKN